MKNLFTLIYILNKFKNENSALVFFFRKQTTLVHALEDSLKHGEELLKNHLKRTIRINSCFLFLKIIKIKINPMYIYIYIYAFSKSRYFSSIFMDEAQMVFSKTQLFPSLLHFPCLLSTQNPNSAKPILRNLKICHQSSRYKFPSLPLWKRRLPSSGFFPSCFHHKKFWIFGWQ